MKILAIETSCDETAVALLDISGSVYKPEIKVLGNSLLSQIHVHKEYGGVYPNLAKREHQKNLPPLLEKTLKEADENLEKPDIDCIAVTQGPGLEPALWVGITFAENLGKKWGLPVIPINHMEGHIWSVLYREPSSTKFEIRNSKLELPAIALLVSGGHTELVYVSDFGVYEILGRTRDDAVGEAFDKVARMLRLPYPGGPKISQLASIHRDKGLEPTFRFPRPMLQSKDLDFSFSGLKTAVLYRVRDMELTEGKKTEVACEFENAAIDSLIYKTRRALELHPEAKTLIVGGGVSANKHLKSELEKLGNEFRSIVILLPDQSLTGDNAVMIGITAYVRASTIKDPKSSNPIQAQGNLSISSAPVQVRG